MVLNSYENTWNVIRNCCVKNEKRWLNHLTHTSQFLSKECAERAKTEKKMSSNLASWCGRTFRTTFEFSWSLYSAYVATGTLCCCCLKTHCVYCVCYKLSLSCKSSMSGCSALCCWLLYNQTDYSNKDNLQCPLWHTFFLSHLPSSCHSLFIPFFPLLPNLRHSIKRSLKCFVSFCLFSLSIATSFLHALFICVTLAASQNSQSLSASPSFSLLSAVLSISRHLQYLPSPSMSISPPFSVWAPAQILLMLLHAGLGPNQQGNKSIQQENYVMCHHIDWPPLLLQLPWVFSSSTPCSPSLTYLFLFLLFAFCPHLTRSIVKVLFRFLASGLFLGVRACSVISIIVSQWENSANCKKKKKKMYTAFRPVLIIRTHSFT